LREWWKACPDVRPAVVVAALLVVSTFATAAADIIVAVRFQKSEPTSTEDPTVGRFYFGANGEWRLDTEAPVRQIMVSTDTLTVILYPREERAFHIQTPLIEPPSYVFFFVHSTASNEQFTQQGLTMTDFSSSGDTTVTRWEPTHSDQQRGGGHVTLHRLGARVVRLNVRHSNGNRSRYVVESTLAIGTALFPASVHVVHQEGGSTRRERIEYLDVELIRDEPVLLAPTIPPRYSTEHRIWR
jgi:hypothetical protein